MILWSNGKFTEGNYVSTFNFALHYSGSVWEGIRSYRLELNKSAQLFHLTDHISRLFDSAKVMRLEIPYTQDVIREACRELQRRNGDKELYFRPIVYPLKDAESSTRKNKARVGVDIYALPLKNGFKKTGIRVITSSIHRSYPEINMQCKSSPNYGALSELKDQARFVGVDDVLITDHNGHYTEASTANLFVVRRDKVWTPPNDGSILPGITRGIIMDWTKAVEKKTTKVDLITASEIFITGTYAEITPVIEVDGYKIGNGEVGGITQRMREAYFKQVRNPLWPGIGGV